MLLCLENHQCSPANRDADRNVDVPVRADLEEGSEEVGEGVDRELHGEGDGEEVFEDGEDGVVIGAGKLRLSAAGGRSNGRWQLVHHTVAVVRGSLDLAGCAQSMATEFRHVRSGCD